MPYAFLRDEAVPAAIRRIMDEQIVRAREELGDASQPLARRVHDARKRLKETRALLQLVRGPLGLQFPEESKAFRDAGRALSGPRDAEAVLEALEKLKDSASLSPATERSVHSWLAARRDAIPAAALEASVSDVLARLNIARARLDFWPPFDDSFETIATGLLRTYRDGRRAMRTALAGGMPRQYHDWRKRAKEHWYHAQLLRNVWPPLMKSWAGELLHALPRPRRSPRPLRSSRDHSQSGRERGARARSRGNGGCPRRHRCAAGRARAGGPTDRRPRLGRASAGVAGANPEHLDGMALMSRRPFEPVQEAFGAVDAPRGRLIVVGDVHGCFDELTELLARIAPAADDLVISVGDMVTKGPHSARCLGLWRDRGYLAVQGNNEVRLLEHARPMLRFLAHQDRDVLWRSGLLRYIAGWPVVIDIPAAGVTAVHGGFLPQMAVTRDEVEAHRDLVYHLRWIRRKNGEWKYVSNKERRKDDALWSEKWRGNRFVVYGHTPLREPRFDKCALGLDTGCVYGGALTAGILERGTWTTVSVPARRKYAE